jgi:hypothetical protein
LAVGAVAMDGGYVADYGWGILRVDLGGGNVSLVEAADSVWRSESTGSISL